MRDNARMPLSAPPPALALSHVTFTYAGASEPALHSLSLAVPAGGFALLTGPTGAGKSTLLALAAPAVAPAGTLEGTVEAGGLPVGELTPAQAATAVGLVGQDPDVQVICDTVSAEMAFGLENVGVPAGEMRRRVAEACTFLGMESWFGRRTTELSGGQRQVLALAATLAMRPRLLLLDEPTAQLDPVAASAFAALVGRANRELGVAVVVATHAPTTFAPFATCAFAVRDGRVSPIGVPAPASAAPTSAAPTAPVPVTAPTSAASAPAVPTPGAPASPPPASAPESAAPAACGVQDAVTSGEARVSPAASAPAAYGADAAGRVAQPSGELAASVRDTWLRYGRDDRWVLRGLHLDVRAGEVHALLGGNGAGKTTLLRLVAGMLAPQRGRVRNRCDKAMAYLPQNPKALLSCETVAAELMEWSAGAGYDEAAAHSRAVELGLPQDEAFAARHPLDLSRGQQQQLALAKLLLVRPRLLLLDEPTCGLDDAGRARVAASVGACARAGTAVLVSTHDTAFARATATTVTLLFAGEAAATVPAGEFFATAWLWGA